MLKKYEVLKKIEKEKIVAIVRVDSEDKAVKCFDALYEGGIKVVEMTFTIPYAHSILESLSKKYGKVMTVGAGTVLDSETARIAMLSGAEFIVSPSLDKGVAEICNRYSVPYFCGIATPKEAVNALELGVDVIKLFPATDFNPSIIKDLKAPLPNLEIMPTGGIGLINIKAWKEAGAFSFGIGGELTKGVKTGDFVLVKETAKKFAEVVKQ